MSHLKERAEKNCLNCNAQLEGRFCHICGQENIEPKETVWHLISHFFEDITHFDGKFFSSLKLLITKPGFLSKEYVAGRRASYLNPIRMYVFTSAIFFLIFFSFFENDASIMKTKTLMNDKSYADIEKMDSLKFDAFTKNINKEDGKMAVPMTREVFKKYFDSVAPKGNFNISSKNYKSKEEYDSLIKTGKVKPSWLSKQITYKNIELNKKYKNNKGELINSFKEIYLHSIPQMFFLSLPIFALILQLLYIRRKQFYYVSHAIFGIHFYIFIFIGMLAMFGLNKLNNNLHWGFITFLQVVMGFGLFFYLYKAMHNFYEQGRGKTIAKFLILFALLVVTIIGLLIIFTIFSLYKL